MKNQQKSIGIIDFNPNQNPDERQYIKRISALIPDGFSIDGLLFRDEFDISAYDALILSGSKLSATDYQRMVEAGNIEGDDYLIVHRIAEQLSEYKGSAFGICFGSQILAHVKGSKLGKLDKTEAGYLAHQLTEEGKSCSVFGHLPDTFFAAHLHTDYVASLPCNADINKSGILAIRNGFIHAYSAVCNNGSKIYGLQAHPEMSNPNDATFLVKVNESWLGKEIGGVEYKRALTIPKNADFGIAETVTRFAEVLK